MFQGKCDGLTLFATKRTGKPPGVHKKTCDLSSAASVPEPSVCGPFAVCGHVGFV